MSQQIINIGTTPNDGTGDPIRTAMTKVNNNFSEIYSSIIPNSSTNNSIASNNLSVNANLSVNVAVSVGNSSVNVTINSTSFSGVSNNSLYLGGTLASGYQTTAGFNSNVAAYLPNYTGIVNGSSYTVGSSLVANTLGVYHTGTVNAASHTTGAGGGTATGGITVNSTMIVVGNATVNVSTNSTHFYAGNSTYYGFGNSTADVLVSPIGNVVLTPTSITISNATANTFVANVTGFYVNTAMTVTPNTLNLGTSTNAANGYTYLPNGFKLNWGWVSANSSAGNVTFPSAYTTNAYIIIAVSNTTTATYQAAVIGQNNTIGQIRTGNATSTNVFWQAIGI
jgi:hypothetical protein